jgi:hypothetical protein
MAQGALVFTWGSSVRGREQKSLDVFSESAAYWDDMVKNGRVSGHYPYFSTYRSGGMWIVHGELEVLAAIQQEQDYQRLMLRVQMIAEDFTAEVYQGGSVEELMAPLGMFGEVTSDLG